MKCEICGLKDAVIHIRQIQKDLVHELHICEECAREKGLIREEESELPIANLLSGLLEGQDLTGTPEGKDTCPQCGMKATDFRKQGKLGCTECFSAFEKDIRAIVSQMATRPRHTGKVPRSASPQPGSVLSSGLREELRSAVEREDYELAASLRDRLRLLDGEGEPADEAGGGVPPAPSGEGGGV